MSTRHRNQSLGEELANAISHGAGLVAAVVVTPSLLAEAARSPGAARLIGAGVFAGTVMLLYLGSTLYHAFPRGRTKHVFHVIERSAIFLLIAGTYTPLALGVLRGAVGLTLIITIWALAVFGVILTTVGRAQHPVLATILYLGMGWLIVLAIDPLRARLPADGLRWLVVGGLAYTVGVAFYAAKRLRYAHFVWHLFVLFGTTCHYLVVRYYAG